MTTNKDSAFKDGFGKDDWEKEGVKALNETLTALSSTISNYDSIKDQVRASLERMYEQGRIDQYWKNHTEN